MAKRLSRSYKTASSTSTHSTALAPSAVASPEATAIGCKIQPSGSIGSFNANAADMPISIKLCEDTNGTIATTSNFHTVSVFLNGSTTPVAGEPTSLKNTSYSISLAAGTYDVVMVVAPRPDCNVAYVFEDGPAASTPLDILAPKVQDSAYFHLMVS